MDEDDKAIDEDYESNDEGTAEIEGSHVDAGKEAVTPTTAIEGSHVDAGKGVMPTAVYLLHSLFKLQELTLVNQTRCKWDDPRSMTFRLLKDRDRNFRARLQKTVAEAEEKYDGCLVVPHEKARLKVYATCPDKCLGTKKHYRWGRFCIAMKMQEYLEGPDGIEAAEKLVTLQGNLQLLEVNCNSNLS